MTKKTFTQEEKEKIIAEFESFAKERWEMDSTVSFERGKFLIYKCQVANMLLETWIEAKYR